MGKLSTAAKAKVTGPVAVTFADGTTRTFATETEAEKAVAGKTVEFRRGGFFETEALATAPAAAPAPSGKSKNPA